MFSSKLRRGFDQRNFPRLKLENFSKEVLDWRRRAMEAGSSSISNRTMNAVDFLYKRMKKNGLISKMKSVVGFVPDNLIAAITPIYYTHGYSTWKNCPGSVDPKFDNQHLDIHGLGDQLNGYEADFYSKWLDTGLNPMKIYSNNKSAGVTIYVSKVSLVNTRFLVSRDFGCVTPGTYYPAMGAYVSDEEGYAIWDYHFSRTMGSNPNDYKGYISFNAVSNYHSIYSFNSNSDHVLIASKSYEPSSNRPGFSLYCFNMNDSNATIPPYNYHASDRTFSFVAVHEGLTEDESRAFSWIIQNYRIKLGGGFI